VKSAGLVGVAVPSSAAKDIQITGGYVRIDPGFDVIFGVTIAHAR
jgi:hypothetical protein